MDLSIEQDKPLLCSYCRLRINLKSQLIFDFEQSIGRWRGQDLHLTAGEFRILKLLIEAHGACCSARALYDVMKWPGFIAGEGERGWHNNVRSLIKRIRHKFRKIDPAFNALRCHNGRGYTWR